MRTAARAVKERPTKAGASAKNAAAHIRPFLHSLGRLLPVSSRRPPIHSLRLLMNP